jgi:hypothetical protein
VDDVFVRDLLLQTTIRVSVSSDGHEGSFPHVLERQTLSADGRYVTFHTYSSLAPEDTNTEQDVYVHDLLANITRRVSVAPDGGQAESGAAMATISGDGNHVVFWASGPVSPDDVNFQSDIYMRGLVPASWRTYGSGWAGTLGVPTLIPSDRPQLCTKVLLHVMNSRPELVKACLFFGLNQANLPTAWDGTLLVSPTHVFPFSLPPGITDLPVAIPCDDVLSSLVLDFQVLEQDDGASKNVSFSTGLELSLGY